MEELLAQIADGNDEEQEDGPAPEAEQAFPAAPEFKGGSGWKSRSDLENRSEPGQAEGETAPAPADNGGLWAADPYAAGANPPAGGGPEARCENGLAAPCALRAWDGRVAEELKPVSAEGIAEDAPTHRGAAERGLEGLYRRTAQAVRPPAQNLPVEQAGRTRLDEKPERAAALTVDELDWAVRRDSRRYDGGMTIY